MINNELIDKLKAKNFKTFWHCFQFLTDGGYNEIDSFSYSLLLFGEDKVLENVAFIKPSVVNKPAVYINPTDLYEYYGARLTVNANTGIVTTNNYLGIIIFLIDEQNKHLLPLYSRYRKLIKQNKMPYSEIEDTCNKIEIRNISDFLIEYIEDLTESVFGIRSNLKDKQLYDITGSLD